MVIIPAIDLRGGKVVRLLQGDFAKETVYADDPVAVANTWMAQGARWLHVVDLDGARTGVLHHAKVIGQIVAAAVQPGTRIEASGGIRSEQTIRELFDLGVHRVVMGTKAAEDLPFRQAMLRQYGRRIAVGVDSRGTQVAVRGWTEAGPQAVDRQALVAALVADGAKILVCTEISRDGTLEGPALESVQQVLSQVGGRAEVIVSGGIGSLEHLKQLATLNPLPAGVIVGRALYEQRFTLADALAAC